MSQFISDVHYPNATSGRKPKPTVPPWNKCNNCKNWVWEEDLVLNSGTHIPVGYCGIHSFDCLQSRQPLRQEPFNDGGPQ